MAERRNGEPSHRGPGFARSGEAVEGEGEQDGDAVINDIAPLQRVAIDEVLEDFQGYSQEENGEGAEDLLTAGGGQEEEQERSSGEGQPMDSAVVAGDHAGPGRLEGADNQEGNPQGGDDAEELRREGRAAGLHIDRFEGRRLHSHYLGVRTTRGVFGNG